MFKRVINKYFEYKFSKRVLIFTLVFALIFAGIDLFVNGTINIFFPDQEVYAHMEDLARSVIDFQNFDALEKSDILKDYTLDSDMLTNTLTLTLYGPKHEVITMVFSLDSFALRSVKELRNATEAKLIVLAVCVVAYFVAGVIFSLAFNFVIKGVKKSFSLNKKTSAV